MENKLLNQEILAQLKEIFTQLKQPVQVLFFGKQTDCEYCNETLQLTQEVVALSDKLSLDVYDLDKNAQLAAQYNVDKAPALVLVGKDGDQVVDYGIRFFGIPSGHEFSSLIHSLILVSGRDSGLSLQTRQMLSALKKPVHLQVFVTPTCPYCPQAVMLAHQMALESPLVQSEMVEATEFPELANRFNVSGVPQTTINAGQGTVVGAYPEEMLVAEIQHAVSH
jgi:glutaredoxin-like protein